MPTPASSPQLAPIQNLSMDSPPPLPDTQGGAVTHAHRSSASIHAMPPLRHSQSWHGGLRLDTTPGYRGSMADVRAASPLPGDHGIVFTEDELLLLRDFVQSIKDNRILTRTSSMSSLMRERHELRQSRSKMHEQMDRIFSSKAMTCYFHAFCHAMSTLAGGAQYLADVGLRTAPAIEMDSAHGFVSSAAEFIGKSVPPLEPVTSLIVSLSEKHNRRAFVEINKKLAAQMETTETIEFVPSLGRPLTLAMEGRLEALASGVDAAGVDLTKTSLLYQYQHMQKRLSGGAGETAAETALVVLAFRHADKIAAAMTDPAAQVPPLAFPGHAPIKERLALTLEWYCAHSNLKPDRPRMHFDRAELTWGALNNYVFMPGDGERAGGAAMVLQDRQPTALPARTSAPQWPTMQVMRTLVENAKLKREIEALKDGGDAGRNSAEDKAMTAMKRELAAIRASQERHALLHERMTLEKGVAILTAFIESVGDAGFADKVYRSGSKLRRKGGLLDVSVKTYLGNHFGLPQKGGKVFTLCDDLIACAKKWTKDWDAAKETTLLQVAQQALHAAA